ncbi:recombination regulator RecX [Lysobacter sp. K5869]|nr:recombination regulator RecX [Lysobacter sp. K5869]
MRAIESGSRSAEADRPSRESLFSDAADRPGTAWGAGSGESPPDPTDSESGQASLFAPPQAHGRHGGERRDHCGGHGARSAHGREHNRDDRDRHRDGGRNPSSASTDDGSPREADPGLFPAQSPPESSFEHPFADGDGHLFDQSTSGPSRRERRRAPREQSPTQRALGLLVRREHSRKELTRKLTSRGLEREAVTEAVDRLAEAGWQDDARFAETLVRSRANNGYGPMHIRAELGTHGLDGEAIAAAMDAFEGDWLENARDLLRRRFGEDYGDDPARRRKAADLLMRRGFEMETIRIASRSYASD